jgi:hypothetical protein
MVLSFDFDICAFLVLEILYFSNGKFHILLNFMFVSELYWKTQLS